jgi:hypothetical protein
LAETRQFLRVTIGGQPYLLPSVLRYTLEKRDNLLANPDSSGQVVAWRNVRTARWPVYGLDAGLRTARPGGNWEQALFLEGSNATIGFVVDDTHLLMGGEVQLSSFTPPGPVATKAGHLFTHAWIREGRAVLVLEPQALTAFLQGLGD